MINALAEVAWTMEIPDDEIRGILRAFSTVIAELPGVMPPAARIEAERRAEGEAVRAFQGKPSRLQDPELLAEFLDEFGWPDMPSAADVFEQLECSISGHLTAYEDAIRRGDEPIADMETLRERLAAHPAPSDPKKQSGRGKPSATEVAAPATGGAPRPPKALPNRDANSFFEWASAYIDRRLAGYLCERLDESPAENIGDRFRRSSMGNYQGCVRLWVDAMGNRRVQDYTPQDALTFISLLERVPANHGKSSSKVPIRDVITTADEQEEIRIATTKSRLRNAAPGVIEDAVAECRIPRLRTATIQRHLSNLHTIFNWAVVSGLLAENPFARARLTSRELRARRRAEADPDRKPWGDALPDLLASRIYVEPLDEPGDPLFWVPLLGLFAGLRMEEALQLRGSDIQCEHGIHHLLVRQGENQSVKSGAGRRRVPIHSSLVELGFLHLAARSGSGRLFPGVLRSKQRGSLSETFSKSFSRYRKREGISAPGRDHHALRSDFNKQMDDAGIPKHVRGDLIGHSEASNGLTDGVYVRGEKPLVTLRNAIETIRVDTSGIRRPFGSDVIRPVANSSNGP